MQNSPLCVAMIQVKYRSAKNGGLVFNGEIVYTALL